MMWLSIHMMTSQSHMCVQYVTNGLHRNTVWTNTEKDTLEKTRIRVTNVRNVFQLGVTCVGIWIFIQVNTSAQNVADVVKVIKSWLYTEEVIPERNRLNVLFAANDSHRQVTLLHIAEFTVERNFINVTHVPCVTKCLPRKTFWVDTEKLTLEKTRICVTNVRNVFHLRIICIAIWIFIQVNTSAQNVSNVVSNKKLAIHRRSHSGEKPFECTVCNKRFTSSSNLASHGRIHSGKKLYKCHMCDKMFTTKEILRRHRERHTGEKLYSCNECKKRFTTLRGTYSIIWIFIPVNTSAQNVADVV